MSLQAAAACRSPLASRGWHRRPVCPSRHLLLLPALLHTRLLPGCLPPRLPSRLPAAGADPIYWCLHVLRSQDVSIEGIVIRGDWGIPNNDGTVTPSACLRSVCSNARHVPLLHSPHTCLGSWQLASTAVPQVVLPAPPPLQASMWTAAATSASPTLTWTLQTTPSA